MAGRNRLTSRVHANAVSRLMASLGASLLALAGCAHVPNQWVEDGPAATEEWNSPTALDVQAKFASQPPLHRGWTETTVAAPSGDVTHWPLYFEDPFADKGHGRAGMNKYHIGWEDYVAMPYCFARYTVNWLMFPGSAFVTPPSTLMESDGELSRQQLGYDHDATKSGRSAVDPPPAN